MKGALIMENRKFVGMDVFMTAMPLPGKKKN
jgi:hypothetical protein